MKKLLVILVLGLLVLSMVPGKESVAGSRYGTGNCDDYGSGLWLFEHADYRGRVYYVPTWGFVTWLGSFNDLASSACVNSSQQYWICEHANFWGDCSRLTQDTPYLGGSWAVGNDRASSVARISRYVDRIMPR